MNQWQFPVWAEKPAHLQIASFCCSVTAVDVLQRVKNRKLLVAGLGPSATIAHKTGDIGFLLGDAGLVAMPSGKRYLIATLVTGSHDDPAARDYIQAVSRLVYVHLSQPPTSGSPFEKRTERLPH